MHQKTKTNQGFTLIELLIVIAIIAILAAVMFVALDPLTRFRDARDSARWSDVSALVSAIKIDQVDNRGKYIAAIRNATSSEVYMITDGTVASGCDDQNTYCDTNVTDDTHCIDLSGLVTEGYLGEIPVSPNGEGTWSSSATGYTLEKTANGHIKIRACESENSDEIYVVR